MVRAKYSLITFPPTLQISLETTIGVMEQSGPRLSANWNIYQYFSPRHLSTAKTTIQDGFSGLELISPKKEGRVEILQEFLMLSLSVCKLWSDQDIELYSTDRQVPYTDLLTDWEEVGGGRELLAGHLQFLFINRIKFTQIIILLQQHQPLPSLSPSHRNNKTQRSSSCIK